MLAYQFMQRALLVGGFLSLILPLMGVIVVNRNTSTVGDAIAHSSLSGIGIGLLFGFSPLIGSILVAIFSILSLEWIRIKGLGRGDLATSIITSLGVGLASLLTDIVPTSTDFSSYLFGSIVTINASEVYISIILSLVILILFFCYYYQLMYISFDLDGALASGIHQGKIDFLFNILLAITIAIGARVLGVLIISSLLILPVACGMMISRSYKKTVFSSMIFGFLFVLLGLVASFYFGIKPGGSIVVIATLCLLFLLLIKKIQKERL